MTTLVITEKPTAAEKIAQALDTSGQISLQEKNGVPYFIVHHHNKRLIIVSALGHLYGLRQSTKGWRYPVFQYQWVPIFRVDKTKTRARNFLAVIKDLAGSTDEYVSACDYDLEGSLIAYNILRLGIGEFASQKAKRMKFSTLTDADLRKAYETLETQLNYTWIEAAKTRHEIDWVFGVNLTRALTLALKDASNYFSIVSTGRVQGPLLRFVVEREKEIQSFIPLPYWVIKAKLKVGQTLLPLLYEKAKITKHRQALQIIQDCQGHPGVVETIQHKNLQLLPPFPFNLGDLQHEAYTLFRLSPKRTLQLAESLYLKSLISYPRTDSQQIPKSIAISDILKRLSAQPRFQVETQQLLQRSSLSVRNGPKTDPAHPAIHPTGEAPLPNCSPAESRLYELITRRFLASMGEAALKEQIRVTVKINEHRFFTQGETIVNKGWIAIYRDFFRTQDISLPPLDEGKAYPVKSLKSVDMYTTPPQRYTRNSLVKLMENQQIGTKATRADIVEILYKRKFLTSTQSKASELALSVIATLERYCPTILDVETTRGLEQALEAIQDGKSNRDQVLQKTKDLLNSVLPKIQEHQSEIGMSLTSSLKKSWFDERMLGPCPDCDGGQLMLIYSPKTRKRFVGCSNYKKGCKTSFPLSARGKIVPLNKTCPHCGYPMIRIYFSPKRRMSSCVNWLNCPGAKIGKTKKKQERKTNP